MTLHTETKHRFTLSNNFDIKLSKGTHWSKEIALRKGFISKEEVLENIKQYKNNEYFAYVKSVISQL